ncbi:MAG: hypothetical protein ACRDTE_10885 [Pseudonocardiaceae bacterium]
MTRDEIRSLVDALGNIRTVLTDTDPDDKAEIYQQLGLRLTYQPEPTEPGRFNRGRTVSAGGKGLDDLLSSASLHRCPKHALSAGPSMTHGDEVPQVGWHQLVVP